MRGALAKGRIMLTRLIGLLCLLIVIPVAPPAVAADSGVTLDARVSLNAYAAMVDQEFQRARDELRVLAASENAASGDWRRIKGPLGVLARNTPTSAAVWFARPDGSYFTVDGGRMSQTLKDRDYFPVLTAGKEIEGDLVVSRSTGLRSAVVAVPVPARGRVIGALGVSIAMEKVAALVDGRIGFPPQVMFYALDGHGQIALHRQSSLLFEFAAQLGSPTLAEAVGEMLAKPEGMVSYEFQGAQRTTIFKRSEATGWVYALRW